MSGSRLKWTCWFVLACSAAAAAGPATQPASDEAEDQQGDNASRYLYTHRIKLYDAEENLIKPGNDPLLPFSTRTTCGKCHDYDTIAAGRHFNAPDPKAERGRAGQPWILVDPKTGTQLPISYRRWEGTFHPDDVGVTPWQFTRTFGRHMPGGGAGERPAPSPPDPEARWLVAGKLEINCLACHSADRGDDMNEWFVQIARGNFMWASAGMSGLASVRGAADAMPETYDPFMEPDDNERPSAPRVTYRPGAFDPTGRVFFDVVRKPDPARCYFCHSNFGVGPGKRLEHETDEDVHLVKGLSCTDCHRNGLDHAIARGDESPGSTLSCRGCHLGAESARVPGSRGGRLGAPVPRHPGLPSLHLEKLTCTACHSGPRPTDPVGRVQTSRAHALEFQGPHRGDEAPPEILWPVFVRNAAGKIEPRKMVYPAYWRRLEWRARVPYVSLIPPETVAKAAGDVLDGDPKSGLTEVKIAKLLAALSGGWEPVRDLEEIAYFAGGRIHSLSPSGDIVAAEHPVARPFSWPIAHDVRPATESLGADGQCTDCHGTDAPMLFGKVLPMPPAGDMRGVERAMYEFQDLDPTYQKAFGFTWVFRPWLKAAGFVSSAIVFLVLLLYGLSGLRAALAAAVPKES